jgi:hypothetical protein
MPESPTPLYVRLSPDRTRRLESAVLASGKTKRQLVEDAVGQHLTDDGLLVGRVALREDPPEVLTLGEAASLLRVDEVQLLQAARRGEVPGRRIAEAWRFSRAALIAWLGGSGGRTPPAADR